MAARGNHLRPKVKLRSTAGTGYAYITTKNRRTTPDRLAHAGELPGVTKSSW